MPRLFSFSVEASELETAPSICPLHRAQRIDKVRRRRPRTNTDNGTRLYVLESGPSYCFFQFILRHDRFACGVKTQGAL